MRIDVFSVCWNERRLLPFFLRHYDPIAQRIIIFDDGSDDGSVEYLRQFPKVEVHSLRRGNAGSIIDSFRQLHDKSWKSSRGSADWVIVADIDEHLYHDRLRDYLSRCKARGITIIPAIGFTMVADTIPENDCRLCDVVQKGILSGFMHKPSIFDPSAIEEINFQVGCHRARPKGRVKYPDVDELSLLHYKHMGLEYTVERTTQLQRRLEKTDLQKKWGFHWRRTRAELERDYLTLAAKAVPILPAPTPYGINGWAYRWWRPQWPWFRRGLHQKRYQEIMAKNG